MTVSNINSLYNSSNETKVETTKNPLYSPKETVDSLIGEYLFRTFDHLKSNERFLSEETRVSLNNNKTITILEKKHNKRNKALGLAKANGQVRQTILEELKNDSREDVKRIFHSLHESGIRLPSYIARDSLNQSNIHILGAGAALLGSTICYALSSTSLESGVGCALVINEITKMTADYFRDPYLNNLLEDRYQKCNDLYQAIYNPKTSDDSAQPQPPPHDAAWFIQEMNVWKTVNSAEDFQ